MPGEEGAVNLCLGKKVLLIYARGRRTLALNNNYIIWEV
jgi:FMN-dependent NADH-azoreductase